MSVQDASRVAKILAEIQYELREDLLGNLKDQEQDLKAVLDPRTFSPEFDEIRDKYLDKLTIIQGVINELANFNLCHTKRVTRIESVSAESHKQLAARVNKKLMKLEGCRIMDVKFIKAADEEEEAEWVAFITYIPNPLKPAPARQPSNPEHS
ncbi:MAG: hypothetical protein O3B01_03770 [Planctomycetota bacterium]|nr:hypothetical protein [Planctomycetota bacterium]MDA1137679.1 hypothetical protein [Planctomycetota bacterium]